MKKQSIAKGFAILSIAGMLGKVLSLLYIPFLKHIIGPEGYGIYMATYQVYTFIFVITNAGVPVAISKLISEFTATENHKNALKAFKIARLMLLGIGTLMAIATVVFAKPLANLVKYNRAYLSVLCLAPSVLFTAVSCAYRGYFQGRGNMTPTAISQIVEQFINIVFSLIFAAFFIGKGLEQGVAGATVGTSLGALISALYLIYYYSKHGKIRPYKHKGEIKREHRYTKKQLARKIIQYGVPITLCVGMNYAGNMVDLWNTKSRLLVAGLSNSEANILYGQLGQYQQLINVPIAIVSSLAAAILPAISGAIACGNKKKAKGNINYSFRLCFLITLPSAIGLTVLSSPIYKMIHLGEGSDIMKYGAVVLILMALSQIQTTILQSIGKLYLATFYSVIGIVAKILVNYTLIAIPSINIMGAIYGSVTGFLIPIILNHLTIRNSLRVKISLIKISIKPLISSLLMGAVVFIGYKLFNSIFILTNIHYLTVVLSTVSSILLGVFAYGMALILTRGIRKKDLNQFPPKIVKIIPGFMKRMIR